ncbi:type II secretion system F family protein [Demequina sp.]|uniref:type II secretion system F family protein n=1 Tax=Demequina sp. TaxID=2050685 RepID=UPI003D146D26
MALLLGLTLGLGLFLVWTAFWLPSPASSRRADGWHGRTQDRLTRAGAPGVTPGALVTVAVVGALVVFLVIAGLTRSPVVAACFAVMTARAPFALVASRSRARVRITRAAWPDAVDHLAGGIRAGLSLPHAVSQLGTRGPEELRPAFLAFAEDFRATGRFGDSLDALKDRLADPVADRIVEALRVTREVGGTDVGTMLRTLSEFLRDDARTRGELEARQSWTVNAARLAVAAPWVVLGVLATRPGGVDAYNSPAGAMVLALGAIASVIAYRLMVTIGRLPDEARVLR